MKYLIRFFTLLLIGISTAFLFADAVGAELPHRVSNRGGWNGWQVYAAPDAAGVSSDGAGNILRAAWRGKLPENRTRNVFAVTRQIRLRKGDVLRFELDTLPEQWTRCSLRYARTEAGDDPQYEKSFVLKRGDGVFRQTLVYDGADFPGGGWLAVDLGGNHPGKISFQKIRVQKLDYRNLKMPPFQDRWTVFPNVEKPADLTVIPAVLPDAAGQPVAAETRRADHRPSQKMCRVEVRPYPHIRERAPAMLYQELISDRDQEVLIGTAGDWWFEFYCNGEKLCDTMRHGNMTSEYAPSNHPFVLPLRKGKNVIAIRLLAGAWGWSFYYGIPTAPKPEITFRAGREWMAVAVPQSVVKPGTALDLSGNVEVPAGKYGRIQAGTDGDFTFAGNGAAIRLQGTHPNFSWRYPWLHGERKTFDRDVVRWAQAIRRQGYNAIRLGSFSDWSMFRGQKDQEIPAESLDRLDRMAAELKKEGIYIQFVVMMYHMYDTIKLDNPVPPYKLMMYLGREKERAIFRKIATQLLTHVNPYTGIAWKDEPALAIVECFNEQYYAFRLDSGFAKSNSPEYRFLYQRWRQFLQGKYGAKPDEERPEPLRGSRLNQPPGPLSGGRSLGDDYALFQYQCILETNRFYNDVIRGTGYRGLISNDAHPALFYLAAEWETFGVADGHNYYAHPMNGMRNPGSKCIRDSSILTATPAFRGLNGQRLYGRPFWVGEYNHCFWNPYQYELPLAFTAYAALNGFGALMIHSDAVELQQKSSFIRNFEVSDSPVQRAGELIGCMLFQRGDLRRSPHRVMLAVPKDTFYRDSNFQRGLSSEQSKLGLLTDFSVAFPWLPTPPDVPAARKPTWQITPSGSSVEVTMHDLFASFKDREDRNFSLKEAVAEMRKRGILAAGNRTNPEQGIFESDTGEILMKTRESYIQVVTPRTEAVAMLRGGAADLGVLHVRQLSVDALVGLTSVDGRPLRESGRMVLVFATQMANSGMRLEGDGETLISIGGSPALMRTGRVAVRIAGAGRNLVCYPLNLDGTRRTALPLRKDSGGWVLEFDTADCPGGPTPFFELTSAR